MAIADLLCNCQKLLVEVNRLLVLSQGVVSVAQINEGRPIIPVFSFVSSFPCSYQLPVYFNLDGVVTPQSQEIIASPNGIEGRVIVS